MPRLITPKIVECDAALEAEYLVLVRHDLEHAETCAKQRANLDLTSDFARNDGEWLTRALSASALIAYRRCFVEGRREWLSLEDIACLGADTLEAHDYTLTIANRCFAHAVNETEIARVGVNIMISEEGDAVVAGASEGSLTGFDIGNIAAGNLASLCRLLIDAVVSKRLEAAKSRVVDAAKHMTSEELLALPCGLVGGSADRIDHSRVRKSVPRKIRAKSAA